MTTPQFGQPDPGRVYKDRPAAFGIVERNGKIAVVRVQKRGHPAWLDLPGGAVDPDESAAQAVVREFAEETGLKVEVREAFTRADQYFVNTDRQAFDNLGVFYRLGLRGEDPSLKVEDDHTLVWMEPHAALVGLRHEAHAWAVAAWLRLRARP
jgi:8-oxo-dGTP diphosphatase